jgi:hypothetical protein
MAHRRSVEPKETVINVGANVSYYDHVGLPYRLHVLHAPQGSTGTSHEDAICVVGDAFRETWEARKVYHAQTIDVGDGVTVCIACGTVIRREEVVQ